MASEPNRPTLPGVPPPPPQLEPPAPQSTSKRFFGAFLVTTGGVPLVIFGGCTGLCIIGEGIPKRQAEFEIFEIGLAGTAIGAALLGLGLYIRRRR